LAKKLNLGSGEFKKPGYVNVDFYSFNEPDVKHDLNQIPYPFEDNEFELIEADHVIEHLHDVFQVMREIHRIGCPGALIVIRVPHFSRGFTHADHKRGFDVSFPLYFDPNFKPGYQGFQLEHEKTTLNWFAQPYLKKQLFPAPLVYIGLAIGKVLNLLANASPYICSRLWCYWVGGFEEIEFKLRVKK
jgi:SAM-dependent methyltransferase